MKPIKLYIGGVYVHGTAATTWGRLVGKPGETRFGYAGRSAQVPMPSLTFALYAGAPWEALMLLRDFAIYQKFIAPEEKRKLMGRCNMRLCRYRGPLADAFNDDRAIVAPSPVPPYIAVLPLADFAAMWAVRGGSQ